MFAVALLGAAGPSQGAAPPNIVLIMCDDMGYEGVSAYGSPSYKTPNLDQLAARGMLFDHCYSQPVCTPSRVQIMTGMYNNRNYTRFGHLDTGQITFGNLLRDAGYATAIAGKWQLGGDAETVRAFGFDRYCLWQLIGRGSRYWDPRIHQDGKQLTGLEDQFGPDIYTDYVCDFIREQKENPFFVYFPMTLTHWPFVPTPDSAPGGSRERLGKYDGSKGGVEYFPDMVNYMDKLIGQIVGTLKEQKKLDNTLLLFTCDNGCEMNIFSKMNGGVIRGGKATMPDAGTHAALVAHWPAGIKKPGRTDALVDLSDMLPTLVAVAGAKPPAGQPTDGVSFLPVLRGESTGERDWVFCHYTRNGLPQEPANPMN